MTGIIKFFSVPLAAATIGMGAVATPAMARDAAEPAVSPVTQPAPQSAAQASN